MNKLNASVVIPSHRFDASTMHRLILTVDLFLNQGFEVVIADNSGVFSKQQQLVAQFGDAIVFANTEADCKAMDNFLAGFAAASGDYVLFATDDDTFFPVGIHALATAIANTSDVAGFCAPTVRYAHEGTSVAAVPDLSGASLSERLTQWIACDIAVCFYGCYSQQIWRRYFRFAEQHPIKLAHHDQLLRFIIADSGNIHCLNTAWFAYDYSNWANGHSAQQSLIHYYTKAGFDERIIYVHSLLEGLEGGLCQVKLDEVAKREFQYVAINSGWWWDWIATFRYTVATHQHTMDSELWHALEPLVTYLNRPEDANVYELLQLLCTFLQQVYGNDGGLQDFWLLQAANSLRTS